MFVEDEVNLEKNPEPFPGARVWVTVEVVDFRMMVDCLWTSEVALRCECDAIVGEFGSSRPLGKTVLNRLEISQAQ